MAGDDSLPPSRDRESLGELVSRRRPLMVRSARHHLGRHPVLKGLYTEEDAGQGALSVLWADLESGKPLWFGRYSGLWLAFNRALVDWISSASRRESARRRGGSGISSHTGANEHCSGLQSIAVFGKGSPAVLPHTTPPAASA